jgi:hypothetical protein
METPESAAREIERLSAEVIVLSWQQYVATFLES